MSAGTEKLVAVFGAGPGLGAAVARRFGRQGHRVALVARRPEALQALVADLADDDVEAVAFPADLSRHDEIPDLVATIGDRLGPIDVEAYAPITGASPFVPAAELTPAALAGYVDLYLYSPIALVNTVLPGMLGRGNGAIVVAQGGSAARPEPFLSGIGPIMAATRNYLYSLHGEVADKGVHVGMLTITALILGSTGAAAIDEPTRLAAGIPAVESAHLADLVWDMTTGRNSVEVSWPPLAPQD